ncbi:MAG: hypothetical protein IT322_02040 [Anaerolineae bacterium]|nr:hypothetical protein [Anaerolineae bacterium]
MTPPPNGTDQGKPEDDPLGGVDPMAWLESLARRQGADPAELVTGGNLDLPIPDAESPKAKHEEPTPAAASSGFDDLLGGADPMAWLEALAKRQGADPAELVTGGNYDLSNAPELPQRDFSVGDEDEKIEDLSDVTLEQMFGMNVASTDEPEPVGAAADDPLGGADPMAWLESLARRQGADPAELVTGGNLDLPIPGMGAEPEALIPPSAPEPVASVTPDASSGGTDDLAALLGGMDPLAFMEQLAAKQGANLDELVTYSGGTQPTQPVQPVEPVEPIKAEVTPEPEPALPDFEAMFKQVDYIPDMPAEPAAPEPVASVTPEASSGGTDDLAALLGGMDPLAFMEQLAAKQGANLDELVTYSGGTQPTQPVQPAEPVEPIKAEVTPEPELALPDFEAMFKQVDYVPDMPAEPAAPEPVASVTPEVSSGGTDDLAALLGGMDPLAFMEQLAAKQGANLDELVTYSGGTQPTQPVQPVEPVEPIKAEVTPEPEPALPDFEAMFKQVDYVPDMPAEPAAPEPVASVTSETPQPLGTISSDAELDSLLGGMDPLAWLEKLAANQGADQAELVTMRGVQPPPASPQPPTEPEIPTPSMIDGTEGEPMIDLERILGDLTPTSEVQPEITGMMPEMTTAADALSAADTMAWLESLTQGGEPSYETPETPAIPAGVSSMLPTEDLTWLDNLESDNASDLPTAPMTVFEEGPTPVTPKVSMEGGMSNDPAEVLAWLESQAHALEETRDRLEHEAPLPPVDENAPAVPGDIPSWLLESMPQEGEMVIPPTTPVISDVVEMPAIEDISPDLGDLPPWLREGLGQESTLTDLAEALEGSPIEEEALPVYSNAELEAIINPTSPELMDDLAEALNEEYERKLGGEDEVPDWYREAVARYAMEEMETHAPSTVTDTATAEFGEPSPEVAEEPIPEWLQQSPTPASEEGIPEWLRMMVPETGGEPPIALPPVVETVETRAVEPPPPLRSRIIDTPHVEMPAVPNVEPEPEVVRVPAPKPEPVRVEPVRQPVRPVALTEALKEARAMVQGGSLQPALERYQSLIDHSTDLEEARGDLRQLAASNPSEPKVFRLLGDAHMRLGDLQAALETYLSALNQL